MDDVKQLLKTMATVGTVVLLLVAQLRAQVTISGKVLDAETKLPLAGAVLQQIGQVRGCVTDSTGGFRLKVIGNPATVSVQFLGYKPLLKRVDANAFVNLVWQMEPANVSLPTTTITDSKVQRVFPDRKVMVVDYELLGDNILMIIYDKKRKRNVLQLFSAELQYLAEYDDPQDPPNALMSDCLGARHTISKYFAGQVDYVGGTQMVLRKDSLTRFHRIVAPCLAKLDSTYFFAFMPNEYTKRFTYLRGTSRRYRSLYDCIDEVAVKKVEDENEMEVRTAADQTVEISQASASRFASRAGFQTNLNRQYLKTVQFPPIFVPIKTVQSSVCIFDHPHSKIVRFDANGSQLSQTKISYHELRTWRKEILTNEEQTAAYTLTEQNGYSTVHQIDLNSGELFANWEIPFQFVQKIKIKGKFIYFTYRDSQNDPIKRLYRMEM